MRERIQRFMTGRYGVDQLSRFLNALVLIMLVLALFVRNGLLYWLSLLLLGFCYFRMFSRNHEKRYTENMRFLKATEGIRRRWNTFVRDMKTRKTHHLYRCPSCRQKIRVPRGKGKIAIRCPKCSVEFIRRS